MEVILPQQVHDAQKFLDCAEKLDYDEFEAVRNANFYVFTFHEINPYILFRKCLFSAMQAAMLMCLS